MIIPFIFDNLKKIADVLGVGGGATLIAYLIGGLRKGLNTEDKNLINSLQLNISILVDELARDQRIKQAEEDRLNIKLDQVLQLLRTPSQPQNSNPQPNVI